MLFEVGVWVELWCEYFVVMMTKKNILVYSSSGEIWYVEGNTDVERS